MSIEILTNQKGVNYFSGEKGININVGCNLVRKLEVPKNIIDQLTDEAFRNWTKQQRFLEK